MSHQAAFGNFKGYVGSLEPALSQYDRNSIGPLQVGQRVDRQVNRDTGIMAHLFKLTGILQCLVTNNVGQVPDHAIFLRHGEFSFR